MKTEPTAPFSIDPACRYHFVGIGGIGMSAIAFILLARGIRVSGSDAHASSLLDRLHAQGAEVSVGHAAEHVRAGDVLVLSDAIKPENPEQRQAEALGLPILKRADLLGYLANSGRGVAVSGTHGKTTTSGMLALIMIEAGMDPTCVLGGELAPLGGNARPGGAVTLVEACEAYNSFLNLHPDIAVVTNIEVDHLDFHRTPERLYASFRQFLRQVKTCAILNGDDPLLATMTALPPRAVTYGTGQGNDYRIVGMVLGAEPSFTLAHGETSYGPFTLRVPGAHNVSNAAGAAALALEMGADPAAVQRALHAFPGMHRRFERLGTCADVAIVDDYAHHPTEIRATLAAARAAFPGRVIAVFQPHLFSRTRDLLAEFAAAFDLADVVLIAPIYAAREAPIPGVDHHQLVSRLIERLPAVPVIALAALDDAVRMLAQAAGVAGGPQHPDLIPPLRNGDVIITLGAGNVDAIARELIRPGVTHGKAAEA